MAKMLKTVEVVFDDNGVVEQDKGVYNTQTHDSKQFRSYVKSEVKIECLANFVDGLTEAATQVSFPSAETEADLAILMRVAESAYGIPVWTQSGIKTQNIIFVREDVWMEFVGAWVDAGISAEEYGAYAGLLFSSMTEDSGVEVDAEYVETNDGRDGNEPCPIGWAPTSCQFRGLRVVIDNKGRRLLLLSKGIFTPRKDVTEYRLNDTQVKVGKGRADVSGRWFLLRNEGVSAERIVRDPETKKFMGLRQRQAYISQEPVLLLNDNKETRRTLGKRVEQAITELVALLDEEHRPDLLERLGALDLDADGNLLPARRAEEEALRSATPSCIELEGRLSRFAVREANSVILSGGIKGQLSLLVISDEYGAKPMSDEQVKAGKSAGFIVRLPTTDYEAVVHLNKSPYRKGIGFVITAEVARLLSGDSDGDFGVFVDAKRDREAVSLFAKEINRAITGAAKPPKVRGNTPLSVDSIISVMEKTLASAWIVGATTVAAWKAAQVGKWRLASLLMEAANTAPMLSKYSISVNGQEFGAYASELLRNADVEDVTLAWRDASKASAGWRSLREIEAIENPQGLIDSIWNDAVRAVAFWQENAGRIEPLNLAHVAALSFGRRGMKISHAALYEAREKFIKPWGRYWSRAIPAGEKDHDAIYAQMREEGKKASWQVLAALMLWRPKRGGTGFGLKWAAVYQTHRATEILGLHPLVEQRIKWKIDRKEAKKKK